VEEEHILERYNRLRKEDLRPTMDNEQLEDDKFNAQYFNHKMLNAPLDSKEDSLNDPELLLGETYNLTLIEMKEHLLKALTNRR